MHYVAAIVKKQSIVVPYVAALWEQDCRVPCFTASPFDRCEQQHRRHAPASCLPAPSAGQGKALHALSMVPAAALDASALAALPDDASPNPYELAAAQRGGAAGARKRPAEEPPPLQVLSWCLPAIRGCCPFPQPDVPLACKWLQILASSESFGQ
jgi:hypothetical protein